MRSAFPILAFLWLTIPMGAARALIFGADQRVTSAPAPGSLFGPVGIVYGTPEAGYATAFLIDECHALTVQHAFGDRRSSKGRRIMFAAGIDGPPGSWRKSWAKVEADGGIENEPGPSLHARTRDWALLRLDKCLGKTFGHVRLSPRLPGPEEAIGMAGYPGDRPLSEGLSIDFKCNVRGSRSLAMLHDCAALPGNSGSPLFRIVEQGGVPVLEVFAIAEAAHSKVDIGRDLVERRDNYPEKMWNVATILCANLRLVAAGLNCLPQ